MAATPVSNKNFTPLDWQDRPEEIQDHISDTFDDLTRHRSSSWGYYNGGSSYSLCGIDEQKLIKTMLEEAPPTQKDFYVLDIGAGNFQWGTSLAKYIHNNVTLPEDMTVHILNVRGESSEEEEITKQGQCQLYKLGAFKVEELYSELQKRGLPCEKGIDMVISSWCFRHLVDPTGTFVQTVNALRPKTGTLIMDGFYYGIHKDPHKSNEYIKMMELLRDTKLPCLYEFNSGGRSLGQFILQRPDDQPCQLPLSYRGYDWPIEHHQIGSKSITHFDRTPQEHDQYGMTLGGYYIRNGDINLFNDLQKQGVFHRDQTQWAPMDDRGFDYEEFFPLHAAITADGEIEDLEGIDLNQIDPNGDRPLHVAIQNRRIDWLKSLLAHGADPHLSDDQYQTPLHRAIQMNLDTDIIELLLQPDIKVNAKNKDRRTPLDDAIEQKNVAVVKLLLDSGAEKSRENRKILRNNEAFTSICKRRESPTLFESIGKWYRSGDYVVLRSPGTGAYFYHQCDSDTKKVHIVDFNPETNLLHPDELPSFLEVGGFQHCACDLKAKIINQDASNLPEVENLQCGY